MSKKTLGSRVQHLEEKVRMLLEVSDPKRHPFTYLALEFDLSETQYKAILDLMDEAWKSLKTTKPMRHPTFEQRVYEIIPSLNGNHEFVKSILLTLNDEGKYEDVYVHMKKDGMNLP